MPLKRIFFLTLSLGLPREGYSAEDSTQGTVFLATPMHKTVVSEHYDPIENERYDRLPACPATPVCTRTREVRGPTVSGRYLRSQAATCPANTVQIAAYNMQDELAWNDNPPPVRPVPIGKWTWYLQNGYTCSPIHSVQFDTLCGKAQEEPAALRNVRMAGVNLGVNPPTPANIGGFAGTWMEQDRGDPTRASFAPYRSSECYTFDCKQKIPGLCDSLLAGGLFGRKFHFPYQLYQCQPPAGLYPTGAKAPVSVVCAHRKMEWQPVVSREVS